MSLRAALDERRELRRAERRRRRGGPGRGPVVLQRTARGVAGTIQALRRGVRRVTAGDRPLVVLLLVAIALVTLLVSGPAQQYLDGSERVATLAAKAEALEAENARLEQRRDDLADPRTVELLAREQQGFARPGEVPYTLLPPEVDRPLIAPLREPEVAHAAPWYRRLWDALRGRDS